jgi:hypothetical protein
VYTNASLNACSLSLSFAFGLCACPELMLFVRDRSRILRFQLKKSVFQQLSNAARAEHFLICPPGPSQVYGFSGFADLSHVVDPRTMKVKKTLREFEVESRERFQTLQRREVLEQDIRDEAFIVDVGRLDILSRCTLFLLLASQGIFRASARAFVCVGQLMRTPHKCTHIAYISQRWLS